MKEIREMSPSEKAKLIQGLADNLQDISLVRLLVPDYQLERLGQALFFNSDTHGVESNEEIEELIQELEEVKQEIDEYENTFDNLKSLIRSALYKGMKIKHFTNNGEYGYLQKYDIYYVSMWEKEAETGEVLIHCGKKPYEMTHTFNPKQVTYYED